MRLRDTHAMTSLLSWPTIERYTCHDISVAMAYHWEIHMPWHQCCHGLPLKDTHAMTSVLPWPTIDRYTCHDINVAVAYHWKIHMPWHQCCRGLPLTDTHAMTSVLPWPTTVHRLSHTQVTERQQQPLSSAGDPWTTASTLVFSIPALSCDGSSHPNCNN